MTSQDGGPLLPPQERNKVVFWASEFTHEGYLNRNDIFDQTHVTSENTDLVLDYENDKNSTTLLLRKNASFIAFKGLSRKVPGYQCVYDGTDFYGYCYDAKQAPKH